MDFKNNKDIDLDHFIESIYKRYGYDFRDYASASLTRRITNFMSKNGIKKVSDLQHRILHDRDYFEALVYNISITVTEMFRDPDFYKSVRNQVIPELKKLNSIMIWHAGCATGEEVYSLAILLKEEGLYEKCQIFATDFNEKAVEKAMEGTFSKKYLSVNTGNYNDSESVKSFSDYYQIKHDTVILNKDLKEKITFTHHNLSTDSVFAEMDLIFCRNVMIYFNRKLQEKVLNLFYDSLTLNGYLCLGRKESLKFFDVYKSFKEINKAEKIYLKID